MTKIVTSVTDAVGLTDSRAGDRAAREQRAASELQADYQGEALEYLKETQAPVIEAQSGSLGRLGNLASSGVNPYQLQSDAQLLSGIENSPLYQSIMSSLGDAEESVLRNQSMTGGFRSGGTQQNLARRSSDLKNQALLSAFGNRQQRDMNQAGLNQQAFQNQLGLESAIMGLPNQVGNVAGLTAGIGQTLAQGQTAAAQSALQGSQANMQNLLGLASAAAKTKLFSDRRLKDNIKHAGKENNFNVYTWDWNEEAEKLGLSGSGRGVIADEVKKVKPEAVKEHSGYDTVDYEMIGVKNG